MSDPEDYRVPPLNWNQIAGKADWLRGVLRMADKPYIDVVHVVETFICNAMDLTEFQVWSRDEMGPCEGETCPQGRFIRFREDVYVPRAETVLQRTCWQNRKRTSLQRHS
jgi:hypothetical protein